MNRKRSFIPVIALLFSFLATSSVFAQGVTTGQITVTSKDATGHPRSGVRVIAVHQPSGTIYQGRTNEDGRAVVPGLRVGGPYNVTAAAIEQMQINIAPFDVRQGSFVGANINTVTRSGTNTFRGSFGYNWRQPGLVGTKAGDLTFDPGKFTQHLVGGWVSGPIIQNKLF